MTKTDQLKSALAAKGLRYVGTRGNLSGPVCFVGEAPGADEDQSGTPFCGASGRELDRMLYEVWPSGVDCWFTNPYKTRPPGNDIDKLGDLGIPLDLFKEQFFEELTTHKPTFIVPLGATPLGILCPSTVNKRTGGGQIGKYRGSILQSPLLGWPHYIIPSFHPAYLFRNWDERVIAVLCLAKAKDEYDYWLRNGKLQPLPERHMITDPSAQDTIDFLRSLLESPLPISIDIENIGVYKGKFKTPQRNRLPYVIGFCNNPLEAICVELAGYEKQFLPKIWYLIDQILRQKKQVGQNYYTHDAPWLQYIGFEPNIRLLHDTLVRHHVLWPELSHKLDFQTMQYTREVYYKDEAKSWSIKEKTTLKKYNCKDVCVTLEIFNAQEEEFNERC